MKIGIITLLGHFNYGNRLQNYALQEFLFNFNVKVESLWFDKNSWESPFAYFPTLSLKRDYSFKSYLKDKVKFILNWRRHREKKYLLKRYYGEECVRQYNIKKFSDKYININYKYQIDNSMYNSRKMLDFSDELEKEYAYFIVGSDQIWYPTVDFYYIKFLKFINKNKRIAYAPSLAINTLPKNLTDIDLLKKGFNEMKDISVREKAGAKIIYNLIKKEVPVLVDPTILLSKEKWQMISEKPSWCSEENYILTYFFGKPSSIIKRIAEKNNWKIYNLMDKNNFNLYTSRVEEFVYLIEHAKLVCTDSFHGTVFSILMNTPFLVTNRKEKGGVDMTSRIDTLLDLFGYQNRYIINGECDLSDEEILHMDFSNVKAIQEREIERSTAYMKKALNLE